MRRIILVSIFILSIAVPSFATLFNQTDQFIITTYYPAPAGAYRQMKIYRSIKFTGINKDAASLPGGYPKERGELVFNNADSKFYLYDGTQWQPVGGGGPWTQSGSNIYYNAGNIGIGTNAPDKKLDVSGDIRASGDIQASGNIRVSGDVCLSSGFCLSAISSISCGDCATKSSNGSCIAKSAGEYSLPACLRCDGTSMTHINIAAGIQDNEGFNLCTTFEYACDGTGYCKSTVCHSGNVSMTTDWGANSYYCSGADKRCYNGSCVTCNGWMYNGYCWHNGGTGESCDSVCASHEGTYKGRCDWPVPLGDYSVCKHWYPSAGQRSCNNGNMLDTRSNVCDEYSAGCPSPDCAGAYGPYIQQCPCNL